MKKNRVENEIAAIQPHAFHTFYDDRRKPIGYLAIDSLVNGQCGGGIRIVPHISANELIYLARAMTLKYAFLNLPTGGAKAAVMTRQCGLDKSFRHRLLEMFGNGLRPFAAVYSPGKDIGIDDRDLRLIMTRMGLNGSNSITDSAFYTAYTTFVCIRELACARGLDLARCKVAIEGYGNVGGHTARLLTEAGARVVAVSNSAGAVYSSSGLEVNHLEQMKAAEGDSFIRHVAGARTITHTDLLTLGVDVLVPCAFSWSIHAANARQVQAKMIVPGANNPVTDRAKETLARRGIVFFPDFVANCGGVGGSMLERAYLGREQITGYIDHTFRPRVAALVRNSLGKGQAIDTVARDIAADNQRRLAADRSRPANRLYALALNSYKRGLLPPLFIRLLAPLYLKRLMRAEP